MTAYTEMETPQENDVGDCNLPTIGSDLPLSSQLSQMHIIGSPRLGSTSCLIEEKAMFPSPSPSISFDRHAWSVGLEDEILLRSPPMLGRLRNNNFLQSKRMDSLSNLGSLKYSEHGFPEVAENDGSFSPFMQGDLMRKNHPARQYNSSSSIHLDPLNPSKNQLLATPPSLEDAFYLLHSARERATLKSPIKFQLTSHLNTSSTLQSFPVSTRGGRGLRRSFISPLKTCSSFVTSVTPNLLFPSPPTSPTKEDSPRVKRLRLFYG